MSRWKELPGEMSSDVRQLVVRLRRLKDHGGLSTRQLAAKTGYSAKSWERYLGGRSLPPRDAVEAMARVVGENPDRLLVLHEVAAETWKAGGASVPEAAPAGAAQPEILSAGAGATGARGRSPRTAVVVGVVALVLAASAAVFLAVRLTDGGGEAATAAPGAPPAVSMPRSPAGYVCRVELRDGRWYAGNSPVRDAVVAYGHAGPEVAEAQCLLDRAGIDPGDIDGIFGPLTQRAVMRVQKRHGLVVDGIIGPHTWHALRERAART